MTKNFMAGCGLKILQRGGICASRHVGCAIVLKLTAVCRMKNRKAQRLGNSVIQRTATITGEIGVNIPGGAGWRE